MGFVLASLTGQHSVLHFHFNNFMVIHRWIVNPNIMSVLSEEMSFLKLT